MYVHACRTVLRQTARIDVHGVPLVGPVLESLWLNQYKSSISNVCEMRTVDGMGMVGRLDMQL